jgi:hypothetical protein
MGKMDAAPTVIGGIAAGLWALMAGKPSQAPVAAPTPAGIAAQAVLAAQQQVASGVPPTKAAAVAATNTQAAVSAMVAAAQSLQSKPLQPAPASSVLSLSDPRIGQVAANPTTSPSLSPNGISAAGMPTDVRSGLVAQGWIWTGSVFNPGILYPPGTNMSIVPIAA